MAYDNLEDEVLLLHGIGKCNNRKRKRGVSSIRRDRDLVDLFTEEFSFGGFGLDDVGMYGVRDSPKGFVEDYTDVPPEKLFENRHAFEELIMDLSNELRRNDSLGLSHGLSTSVVQRGAAAIWEQLQRAGSAVREKVGGALQNLTSALRRGNDELERGERFEEDLKANIQQVNAIHNKSVSEWREGRSAILAATQGRGVGGFSGDEDFVKRMDANLNQRRAVIRRMAEQANDISRQRRMKAREFTQQRGRVTNMFSSLPGVGDVRDLGFAHAKLIVAAAVAIVAIVGALIVINKNLGNMASRSKEEINNESRTNETIEETIKRFAGQWGNSAIDVGYRPGTDKPIESYYDDEGRLVGIRFHDRFVGRDVDVDDRRKIEERDEYHTERRTVTEEGALSQLVLPLVVGGVGIAALFIMTRSEGRETIKVMREGRDEGD